MPPIASRGSKRLFVQTGPRARRTSVSCWPGPSILRMDLPPNIRHEIHLYPRDHAAFYSSNYATLNLTRDAMRRYGWSPASRLFEAAACGACIISDTWPGLDSVLEPGREVLLADSTSEDVAAHLDALTPQRRAAIGRAARDGYCANTLSPIAPSRSMRRSRARCPC